ncbi:MAG: hypothetical protein ACK43M_14510 [Allorhizobium sp.]
MAQSLPLFDRMELDRIRRERVELQRMLKRGGFDARSRIRREQRLAMLTARQVEIEQRLGIGGRT